MKIRNYILCFTAVLFSSVPLTEVQAEDKSIPVSLSVTATSLDVTLPQSIGMKVNADSTSAIVADNYTITNNAVTGNVLVEKINVNVKNEWKIADENKDFIRAKKDSKELYLGLSLGTDSIYSMTKEYIPSDNMIKASQQKNINIEAKTGIVSSSVTNQNIADIVITIGRDMIYDKYNISYNVNGGVMPSSYPTEFTELESFDLPVPTYTNYTFLGWCTDKGLTSTPMMVFPTGQKGNKILYAKWEQKAGDKSGLITLYDRIILEVKDGALYKKDATWTAYESAIALAKTVLDDKYATTSAIQNASTQLMNAYMNLRKI